MGARYFPGIGTGRQELSSHKCITNLKVGFWTRQERSSAQDTGVAAVDVLSTSRALAVIALPLGRVQLLQPAATIQVAIAGEALVQIHFYL